MESNVGFQEAIVTLLKEAFEGRPEGQNFTWFVQGREGIFDAIETLDAESASIIPTEDCASIAAHAYHLLFIMCGANMCQGRPAPEGTWEATWDKNEVSDEEWDLLQKRLREEYVLYIDWFRGNSNWTQQNAFVGTLTPLPHVAFHLGAIRQILKVI